jgi:hypothetical protein
MPQENGGFWLLAAEGDFSACRLYEWKGLRFARSENHPFAGLLDLYLCIGLNTLPCWVYLVLDFTSSLATFLWEGVQNTRELFASRLVDVGVSFQEPKRQSR